MLVDRWRKNSIDAALKRAKVVGVFGPRQSGKTTLVQHFVGEDRKYFNLDNEDVAAEVRSSPNSFLAKNAMAVIDEVQRVPELLRAIKLTVDEGQKPERYIITGSSSIQVMPESTESLAGRIEVINLQPLGIAEIKGANPIFLQMVFNGDMPYPVSDDHPKLNEIVLRGGYPESVLKGDLEDSRLWLHNYINQIIRKDFKEMGPHLEQFGLDDVLKIMASCFGSLLSLKNLVALMKQPQKEIYQIIDLLEGMYLIKRIRPHHITIKRKFRKEPKLTFQDSGVLSSVLGLRHENSRDYKRNFGKVLETFVFSELQKQYELTQLGQEIEFYRDKNQKEVDFVLRSPEGQIVAIEVKASSSISVPDFSVMYDIADQYNEDFLAGIVLHGGDAAKDFSKQDSNLYQHHFWSLPISYLWGSKYG